MWRYLGVSHYLRSWVRKAGVCGCCIGVWRVFFRKVAFSCGQYTLPISVHAHIVIGMCLLLGHSFEDLILNDRILHGCVPGDNASSSFMDGSCPILSMSHCYWHKYSTRLEGRKA